jgi:BlaI family penicillinase repressor
MINKKAGLKLSRRQNEILDIIFRLGQASVTDIMEHLSHSPTDGAVRRMLNLLYSKGIIDYTHEGARKIYRPRINKKEAQESALNHVVETFFSGSAARTMASLLEGSKLNLTKKEKKMLFDLIEKAKKNGR